MNENDKSSEEQNNNKPRYEQTNLQKAIGEYSSTFTELANKLKVSKSRVSEWYSGKGISEKSLQKLAPVLNKDRVKNNKDEITIKYLRGDDKCKSASNQEIFDRIGLTDEPIESIKKIKEYTPYDKTMSLFMPPDYWCKDIYEFIIGNQDFWNILIEQADDVLSWRIDPTYFDDLLNNDRELPRFINIKPGHYAKSIINKALENVFDDYIEYKYNKLIEEGKIAKSEPKPNQDKPESKKSKHEKKT